MTTSTKGGRASISLACVIATLAAFRVHAAPGDVDLSFDPGSGVDNTVWAIALRPDGKAIIGGEFTSVKGLARNRIARLNIDGSGDTSFNPGSGANSTVQSIAVQPDGKVLIGGSFSTVNGSSHNGIARLNADGSLDSSFNPGAGPSAVAALAVQPDGKVLIAGGFTVVNGISRNFIARLNADGSLDSSFNPSTGLNNGIRCIALQLDGKVVIAGFETVSAPHSRIVRLNGDGSLDNSFDSGTGLGDYQYAYALAVQADGKILIGGSFSTVNGTPRGTIARLNPDGSLDGNYQPAIGNTIVSITLQSDGKALTAGFFNSVGTTSRNRIARLNVDGSLDNSFDPGSGANDSVLSVAVHTDGKVLLGGAFTSVSGIPAARVAKLNNDGSLDTTFNLNSGIDAPVRSAVVQPDGKVLIGGDFTAVGAIARNFIARLNADGHLDSTFNPGTGADSLVNSVAMESGGKIVVGGRFSRINGVIRNGIARLNSDGSLDANFNPGTGANDEVRSVAIQSDGKVIIGGQFTSINGINRSRIARLNADGSLDTTFDPGTGPNSLIHSVAVQSDGKVLIGGFFTAINETSRNHIARLNADGSLDSSFDAGTGTMGYVVCVALQSDGKALVGGYFGSVNGINRNSIARLNADGSLDTSFNPGTGVNNSEVDSLVLQADGKLLVGGFFTSFNGMSRNGIARLNADGTVDTSFDPGTGAPGVTSIALQPDGKPLIGGFFSTVNGLPRSHVARLLVSTPPPTLPPVTRHYVGPSGGFWSDTANWGASPGGAGGASAPGPNDDAFIQPSSPCAVSLDTDIVGVGLNQFGIGGTGGAMAQFFQNANALKITERLSIGDVAGSQATYSLNNGTLDLTGDDFAGPLLVGRFGKGILNIAGTAVITTKGNAGVGVAGDGTVNHASGSLTIGSGRSLFIGRLAGSQGAYSLSGSASLSLYGGNLQLGYEGSGSFTQNGGIVLLESPNGNAGHVMIANAASASGSYTLNSGTLRALSVRVGGDVSSPGGPGALTVNGGMVQAALQVWNNGTVTLNNGIINVGSDPLADNIRNDGLILNKGGSLIVGGRIYGTGEIIQSSGAASFADQAVIDTGGVTIAGGAATAAGTLLVGRNAGSPGILNVTGGSLDVSNGVLGVGNGGSLTTGNGHGFITVANAVVTAASIQLGSANGGSGEMTIDNGGDVTVLGGFSMNDAEVKQGGKLRVLYNPAGGPSFEDPNLHNRILAGYLRDGALNVTGGTVSAPEIVVGLANGNGTLNLSSGSVTATGNLLVGVDSTASGVVNITGGALDVSNGVFGVGNGGSLTTGNGHGSITVANAVVTAASIQLGSANGGSGELTIDNGGDVNVLGGFTTNDAEVKQGGRLRVLYNPAGGPSFEDPNLHNRILAGYLRDGALNVTGGTVSAPEIVVGLANGNGTLNLSSGSVTATGNLLVGVDSTASGVVNITGGTLDVSNGVLGVGNGGSLTSGNGHGSITVANAVVTAASIQLGSANGGSGEMTIDNGGDVTVLGGFSLNDAEVKQGGRLRVLFNPAGFSFEDPMMRDRIVGGYLRDGTLKITGGTVGAPEMLLGVTGGKTGTLTMSSGTLTVENHLVVGDCIAGADGVVTLSGGTIYVTNPSHTATLDLRRGSFLMTGGTLVVDHLVLPNNCGATFTRTGGTILFTDTTPPEIHCPANIVTSTDAGQCSAVVNFTVTATDNSAGATVACLPASGSIFAIGMTTVNCSATDPSGNQANCNFTVTVENPPPAATITGPSSGAVYPVGAMVSLTGNLNDNAGDTHTAVWMVDNFALAGTVNEANGQISSTAAFSSPGVYLVKLTVTDACTNTATTSTVNGLPAMLVIYDPSGGFVTGGGWFNSPAGAYVAQPLLTGKASFGFVSKYKKGLTVPTGETEFQFQVASFNFHSTSYEWLVVSGARAQYKGSGTVNNAGSYGFLLTAIDGAVKGGGGADKFRIKVWDKSSGAMVYDNQLGASDSADPSTAISGGSIVIQ